MRRNPRSAAQGALRAFIPQGLRSWFRSQQRRLRRHNPANKLTDWRKHIEPVSRQFGLDRGSPIDRYYIESFLSLCKDDIRGYVLEIADDTYTLKFGGDRVTHSDVLNAAKGNSRALVVDLTRAEQIPSQTYDCIIFTQTLQMIFDVRTALRNLCRMLKPGGVLLATLPGISQISRYDMDRWGDFWRFTTLSARRLFEEAFPSANVTVQSYGNVLVAVAFLHGLANEELRKAELDYRDPDYEVLITVRVMKPQDGAQ
jgi:SAM-dependent methyltransferase